MAEALRHYEAIPDMGEQHVRWKKFRVYVAGNTNGAHLPILQFFSTMGQTEVNMPEECDYFLVFCPAVSRVGTDIGDALANIPQPKPVILVVMHHTFDRQRVVAESWRQVENPNVRLTVDCLFYEGRLLSCSLNDTMRANIQRFFGAGQVFKGRNWIMQRRKFLVPAAVIILVVVVVAALIIGLRNTGSAHQQK